MFLNFFESIDILYNPIIYIYIIGANTVWASTQTENNLGEDCPPWILYKKILMVVLRLNKTTLMMKQFFSSSIPDAMTRERTQSVCLMTMGRTRRMLTSLSLVNKHTLHSAL